MTGSLLRRTGVAAALALLAACGSTTPTLRPSHPRADPVHGAVPWRALPAMYLRIPTHPVPARPDWHRAVGTRACRAGDLRVTDNGVEPAAGTAYLWVTLRLVGPRPCRVEGHPQVTLLDRGRDLGVATRDIVSDDATFVYPHPVLVRPGVPVRVSVLWTSLWCTDPVRNDQVRLSWRGAAWTVRGFGASPGCNGTPGQGPTPVGVSTFLPSDYRAGHPGSAYDGVRARLRQVTAVRAGLPTWYAVTVVASHDVRLVPCPDIRVAEVGEHKTLLDERYQLNCAGVPGATLPAGRPVRFALRVGPLPHGDLPAKLLWALQVPAHEGAGVVAGLAPR